MYRRTVWLLWAAQTCFYTGVLMCVAIKPSGLSANHGLSYYGHYRATLAPYIIALAGSALFSCMAALTIRLASLRIFARAMIVLAALEIVIVALPDLSNHPWILHVHTAAGTLLFIDLMVLGLWILKKLHFPPLAVMFMALEAGGGLGSAYWVLPVHGYLLQAQVVFMFGSNCLLVYAANRFRTDTLLQPDKARPARNATAVAPRSQ